VGAEFNEAMRLSAPASTFAKDDKAGWLLVVFHRMSLSDREKLINQAREVAP
jgi:hypothetical protein